MSPRFSMAACGLFLFAVVSPACAQQDPTAGPERFPQFRNISALSGGGYGVDASGQPSLSGPTALSTPIAHVLGHNHLRVGGAAMSFDSSPTLDQNRSNGTGFVTYGATIGPVNILGSVMFLSGLGDLASNFQLQYVPRRESKVNFSLGLQDASGNGGSAGEGFPGADGRLSRSFFGVATIRMDTGKAPVYLSGGLGTRRFKNGFVSISHQVAAPVRLWAEYDGFDVNEGVLFSIKPGNHPHGPDFNLGIGFIRSRAFTLYFSAGI